MKFVRRLLHWNDQEAEDLRLKMRESVAEATAHAEELTKTLVLNARDIEKAIKRAAK